MWAQRAFSLMELLVVAAIISVLAACLLPSIENSLSQARLMSCGQNVRQIGAGIASYASENRDLMPGPTSTHTIGWSLTLYTNYGWGPATPKGLGYAVRGGYFGDTSILYCPAAESGQSWNVEWTSTVYPGYAGRTQLSAAYAATLKPFMPADGVTTIHRAGGYSFIPGSTVTRLNKVAVGKPLLCDFILAPDWHNAIWSRLYADGHIQPRKTVTAAFKCAQQFATYPGWPGNWGDAYGIFAEICKQD